MKICLIGDAGVGKTSIIRRFVRNEFDSKYIYTLGTRYDRADVVLWLDGYEYQASLRIWDIMGERTLRSLLQDSYLDSADGILLVCDLTRPETLEGLREWLDLRDRVAPDARLLFLANKADLVEAPEDQEPSLARLASAAGARHLLVSAKDGTDIQSGFRLLAQDILEAKVQRTRIVAH